MLDRNITLCQDGLKIVTQFDKLKEEKDDLQNKIIELQNQLEDSQTRYFAMSHHYRQTLFRRVNFRQLS